MRVRRFLAAAVVASMATAIAGAQSIRGTVVDSTSGKPVPDARVGVYNTPLRTIADSGGRFEFSDVSAGRPGAHDSHGVTHSVNASFTVPVLVSGGNDCGRCARAERAANRGDGVRQPWLWGRWDRPRQNPCRRRFGGTAFGNGERRVGRDRLGVAQTDLGNDRLTRPVRTVRRAARRGVERASSDRWRERGNRASRVVGRALRTRGVGVTREGSDDGGSCRFRDRFVESPAWRCRGERAGAGQDDTHHRGRRLCAP